MYFTFKQGGIVRFIQKELSKKSYITQKQTYAKGNS